MSSKLFSPLLFCNDVNIKALIQISKYDINHVLITCKSFVKRFNIESRKQVNSWITTSWNCFTSGAVKDPSSQSIYAISNCSNIIHWKLSVEDIERAKKHSFSSNIWCLLATKKAIYVVYSSGFIEIIDKAIEDRKVEKEKILRNGDTILEATILATFAYGLLLVQNKGKYFIYRLKLGSNSPVKCIEVCLSDSILNGYSFLSSGKLCTTWSNGFMYSMNLTDKNLSNGAGSKCGKINLRSSRKIKIVELSSNFIALQGMCNNEEGGVLLLWDLKFNVCVSQKPLKMYRDPPLAWAVDSNIFVVDGGSLAIVNAVFQKSCLASMVASRANDSSDFKDDCTGWHSETSHEVEVPAEAIQTILSNKSVRLNDVIQKFANQGTVSEAVILDKLIPHLIDEKETKLLEECLLTFTFIPEKLLVKILIYFMNLSDAELNVLNDNKKNIVENNAELQILNYNKKSKKRKENGIENLDKDIVENNAEVQFLNHSKKSKKIKENGIENLDKDIVENNAELKILNDSKKSKKRKENGIENLENIVENNAELQILKHSKKSKRRKENGIENLKNIVENNPELKILYDSKKSKKIKENGIENLDDRNRENESGKRKRKLRKSYTEESINNSDKNVIQLVSDCENSLLQEKRLSPFSESKMELINLVLTRSISEAELSNCIDLIDFSCSLILIQYLQSLICSSKCLKRAENTPNVEEICTWFGLILNVHYHQLVMTSEIEIHKNLLMCLNDVDALREVIDVSQSIEILIERILDSKPLTTRNNLPYNVEQFDILVSP